MVFLDDGSWYGLLLSRFCATIREIRDFNREMYGTNRESVCINRANVSAKATVDFVEEYEKRMKGMPNDEATRERFLKAVIKVLFSFNFN
eukprot:SAG31_NODE_9520_length_1264_cov_4.414592_1_plen_89_part_01